jgi:Uncharacterized protein conserved in bacteria
MGSPIDPVNYVSTLHNAAPLISKETNLQKSKQQNSERTQVRKPKSFLDLILDSTPEEVSGIDYEKRLIGLSPEEKRKAIEDILAGLQDKVYSCGSNLADNVNTDTINEYKAAVRAFVNFAVNNALDVKSIISGGLNPLKQRNYVIVKVINKKIEKLTNELLFNQLEKFQILERLDEIKGLLVDLTT